MPGTAAQLACARCGYDLSGVAAESGECPECGVGYSRAQLARQAESLTRLGLNLTVCGTGGILLAFGIGQCVAAMPAPTQGSAGQAGLATLLLTLVPAALFALGVGILSASSGHAIASRGWPAAVAVIYLASTVFAVAAIDNTGGPASIAQLLQVIGWIPLNAWLLRVSQALAFAGAAAALRRVALALDAGVLARSLRACVVVGFLAAAMHLLALFRDVHSGTRGPWTDVIDNWVIVLTAFPSLSAALGVLGGSLVIRNQWIAAREVPGQSLIPEPNPPAARQ